MKRVLIYILVFIIHINNHAYSQNCELDSFAITINSFDDTAKVAALIEFYSKCEQNNIQEGLPFLDKANEIAKQIDNEKWVAKVYMKYGNFYNITGQYDKAIDYYERSQLIFNKYGLFRDEGAAYNNLGSTYEKMGNYQDAMNCLIKALSLYDQNTDSLSMAKAYLNLGLLHFRQSNYKKSMDLYQKSLDIREKLNDKEGIALIYNNMAIVNYYLEDYDNVRNYFEKSYNMYVELGLLRRQIMALSNLAEILNIIGQREKALEKYLALLELEKELGLKGDQAQTLYLIGDLYYSREDFTPAKKYFLESLKIAEDIGALVDVANASAVLADIYKKEQKYDLALKYHEQYFAYNDSFSSIEKSKQIKEIETRYETKKKEQLITELENQKVIQDLKIKRQKLFIFSVLAGLISISAFLAILFRQNSTIRKANKLLAYQKKQITDSIEYASRIQTAILPPGDYIERVIPDHFIFYKPRDIVSGDFYWLTHKDGKIVLAAVDCTGHGVPGAFMSMLGFAFLNEIVNKKTELKANQILNQLRDYVKSSLHQTGKENETKDGMDIALCIIDPTELKMQYAGAYNPLYLIRNLDIIPFKADRMPIGIHLSEKESFTNHEFDLKKGDTIYIFTDGYIDQFGGNGLRKFKLAPFRDLLISINQKPMKEQERILEDQFYKWKGDYEQIDDILVMGVKV